ncbi:MAG TPA: hypothetical protein ENK02_05075 [Planctomycetes bacterium]|nr:hypothetical protein [Planctomycetota bacterium]
MKSSSSSERKLAVLLLLLLQSCPATRVPPRPKMAVLKKEMPSLPIPRLCRSLDLFTEEGFIRVQDKGNLESFFQAWAWISALDAEQAKSFVGELRIQNAAKEPGLFRPRLLPKPKKEGAKPFFPAFLGYDGIAHCPPWQKLRLGTIGGICSTEGYQAESIQAYAAHGTLRLGAAKDRILFKSASGAVTITGPFRSAQGETDSGPVRIQVSPLAESLDIQTQSGNLALVIQPGVRARIDFVSDQGNVIGKIPYGDRRVEPSVSSRRPSGLRHILLTIPPDFRPGTGANDNPGVRIRFHTREGALILMAPQAERSQGGG